MMQVLLLLARHSRTCLILGLLGGLLLPGLAAVLRPWIPEMVAALLFLTAFRIGPRATLGNLRDAKGLLGITLLFQLVFPLVAALLVIGLGLGETALALALVMALSAPAISGAANFSIILGHDPVPALRLMLLGTALVPLTVLPILWALPAFGSATEIAGTALRLLGVICVSVVVGFVLRQLTWPELSADQTRALDGLAALMLGVIVIGLMAAVGPALRNDLPTLLLWLGIAFMINFGMQLFWFTSMAMVDLPPGSVPVSIVAGNRNVALFLVALPPETTEPLLIFIGCYQIPMFLTPILLRPLYARVAA